MELFTQNEHNHKLFIKNSALPDAHTTSIILLTRLTNYKHLATNCNELKCRKLTALCVTENFCKKDNVFSAEENIQYFTNTGKYP